MHLGTFCEALESKKENTVAFDKAYLDIISTFSIGTFEFASLSNDPSLESFIQLIIEPFSRINPESQESITFTEAITKFLKSFSISSPSVHNCLANHFPFHKVIETISNNTPPEIQKQLLELTAIISDGILNQPDKEQYGDMFHELVHLLTERSCSSFALCTISSLLRSRPLFLTFVRTSPDLKTFRDLAMASLSSDDHLTVLSALSSLLCIFPRSIDGNTVKAAALHAISVSGDNILILKCAIHLLTDISVVAILTEEEIKQISEAAVSSVAIKSMLLINCLNRIIINRESNFLLTFEEVSIDSVIDAMVSTPYGFVSHEILMMIEQLYFQNTNLFDKLEDTVSHITKSLRILSSPPSTLDYELLEGAATILKFFSQSEKLIMNVKSTLEKYEEQIFVAFQRQIESSEPYVSLIFFLFISFTSYHIDSWRKRLRLVIIDSQFSALLAHVIENMTDRKALLDAVTALSQISKLEIGDKTADSSVLFDSIISGFMTINLRSKEEKKKVEMSVDGKVEEVNKATESLKARIECHELEIQSLYTKNEDLQSENDEMKQKIEELEKELKNSKEENEKLNQTNADLQSKLDKELAKTQDLTTENLQLKASNSQQKQKIDELTKSVEEYKQQIQNHVKTERENAAYEVKVGELQGKIDMITKKNNELTVSNESLKNKLKDLKAEFATKSDDFHNIDVEREKASIEINNLKVELRQSEDARKNIHDKSRLLKEKLRETIKVLEEMHQVQVENRREIADLERRNAELMAALTNMEADKKQFELITQFVHRITDESPIPPEQLLTMLDESKN